MQIKFVQIRLGAWYAYGDVTLMTKKRRIAVIGIAAALVILAVWFIVDQFVVIHYPLDERAAIRLGQKALDHDFPNSVELPLYYEEIRADDKGEYWEVYTYADELSEKFYVRLNKADGEILSFGFYERIDGQYRETNIGMPWDVHPGGPC